MQQLTTQNMEALAKGNKVRLARAADKKLVNRRRLNPATLVRQVPDHWQTAMVADLLVSMPRVGRTRALRMMRSEGLEPSVRFNMLSEGRRERLARHVDAEVDKRNLMMGPIL